MERVKVGRGSFSSFDEGSAAFGAAVPAGLGCAGWGNPEQGPR